MVQELERLGALAIDATQGGVEFQGSFTLGYYVNLESRIASRVLLQLAKEAYHSEHDIYRIVFRLAWWEWFTVQQTIKVKVQAKRCPLASLDFVTLRIKDAVCDAFMKKKKARPHVDTHNPDIQIVGFLDERRVTVYLDTSGEPLFKRGWSQIRAEAPIRENLAAGLLRLAGWTEALPLLDPMCGGGTILIEAAHMAKRVAPGLGRRFAFQTFQGFDAQLWDNICRASVEKQQAAVSVSLFGSDRNEKVLRIAEMNCQTLGLSKMITLQHADVLTLDAPRKEGILLSNPPYGVRLGEYAELAEFYPQFGDVLKKKFFGWRAYIFTADRRVPKMIRLLPTRKVPLFNGDLECRLYEFKLVQGGHRKRRRSGVGTH
ncbi:MAG: ribosomal RNA large subunit methyltransferase L [Nitrospirales bacterium]|nr:MAG: ribosomal RNA large subunit methyltransferase L [Nitrospirales bacterium]